MQVKNVVIINDFNYIQGGASKVAIDTARLLNKEGIKVYFFSAVNKKDDEIKGIEYISTKQNEALKEKNRIKGIINGIYNVEAKKELKKLLVTLDKETTVIHIHGWTKALSSSVFDIAFKMKFKVVITLHDYFTACPNGGFFDYRKNEICKRKPLSWKCIKCNCDSRNYAFKIYRLIRQFVQNKIVKINNKLTYIITISDFSEKILRENFEYNADIQKIYNPIDMYEHSKKVDYNSNIYYLYVGRVSKEKGVDIFCDAISGLELKGIVVGDGEERAFLEKKYPLINFVGWKNSEEVKEYMKNAKALIFPSRWYETAGLTILEAQSLGIPCFVSNNCAGKEFIENNINGIIFKDVEDLKLKLKNTKFQKDIKINQIYSNKNYFENYIEFLRRI